MPARPCPKCKKPLEIPQPLPAKVQCPLCGAVIRLATASPVATQSNPDLALSRHNLHDRPLPPQEDNPFAVDDAADPSDVAAPARRRKGGNGLLYSMVGLLLLACGVLAIFLILRKKEEPPEIVIEPKTPTFDNLQARINEATIRGISFLKKQVTTADRLYYRSELADVAPANAHLGATALTGLTLLECGVPADDPAIERAAQAIRSGADQMHATYTLATAILFLDRLYAGKVPTVEERQGEKHAQWLKDVALIRSFALRIMTCQDKGGFWGYGRKVTKDEEERTFQTLKSGKFEGDKLWYKNLSNSQFAALSLWAARRHGVPVRPSLEAVAKAARLQQKPEGTWHYDQNLPMTHSSVCAGLIFLALERGLEEEGPRSSGKVSNPNLNKDFLKDPAVKKGLDFLGKVVGHPPLSAKKREERKLTAAQITDYYEKYEQGFEKQKLPPVSWTMHFAFSGTILGADSWGDLYLLWSIERVAVIYDQKKIGGKDWYAWGADVILNNQQPDGGWSDRFPGVPDTCFALLFLKRANLVKDLTDKIREVMMQSAGHSPPPGQMPKKE